MGNNSQNGRNSMFGLFVKHNGETPLCGSGPGSLLFLARPQIRGLAQQGCPDAQVIYVQWMEQLAAHFWSQSRTSSAGDLIPSRPFSCQRRSVFSIFQLRFVLVVCGPSSHCRTLSLTFWKVSRLPWWHGHLEMTGSLLEAFPIALFELEAEFSAEWFGLRYHCRNNPNQIIGNC